MSIIVKFKRIHTYARIPTYAHSGDACADVFLPMDYAPLEPGEIRIVPLGFACHVPVGWEIQVRSRSGLASRGIIVANGIGTIDSGYTGEVGVILMNMSGAIQPLLQGDRVCQLKISRADQIQFEVIDELDFTERGEGGYGSSGN